MCKNHFVITINREFGAEGHEIGKILSERMKISFYDKDILKKAATRLGKDSSELIKHDESIEHRLFQPYFIGNIFSSQGSELFQKETQVIMDLYSGDSCIVVGRLSDYILRDYPDVLKVNISAPEKYRIENIKNKHHITEKEATKLVKQMDSIREEYYKFYTLGKWNQKTNKDIIINRASYSIEGCANLIELALKSKLNIN